MQWLKSIEEKWMERQETINFGKTYSLGEEYESIKTCAEKYLNPKKHPDYSDVIAFNDADRSVRFTTERLIPTMSTHRPHVMLLFSNPHPHSIKQGMFLSASTKGQESTFWPTMRNAGWFALPESKPGPEVLRDLFLHVKYHSPFELSFYCYYAFPTRYPDHIREIFGKGFFNRIIEDEAKSEFRKIVDQTGIEAIVTFNKDIFNHVAREKISTYIDLLKKGEIVLGQVEGAEKNIPIFLTYPTGWRYHSDYRSLRKSNLEKIKEAIRRDLNSAGRQG
jgi:hypothetical protein